MPKINIFFLSTLILLLIAASGCDSLTASPATPDVGPIRTSAVETVLAQATQDALLSPVTATFVPTDPPPTETLPPAWTATLPPPTATIAVEPTFTVTPTTRPITSRSSSLPAPTRMLVNYNCQLVSQSPIDGKLMKPFESFDGRWTLKNTGSNIWTPNEFQFRFLKGENLATKEVINLTSQVNPGESFTFVVDMKAPSQPGIYVAWWQMRSDNNDYFCPFYLAIKVE